MQGKEDFSQWRSNFGFIEIPFIGHVVTWYDNRENSERIYERFDRAYGSQTLDV